jgi:hypothetical protein
MVIPGCTTTTPAGDPESVDRGLEWLANHQDENGRWDADGFMKHDTEGKPCDGAGNPVHDVGATGLALLAFLGKGNTLRSGPHKDVVIDAVKWLRSQQGLNGLFGTNASHDFIYDHAIATYAMCEAYGLSDYKTLRKTAQGGINYLESHRNAHSCWRYQPRDGSSDSSVTFWCVFAYIAARDFKLEVNPNALKIADSYYDQLINPKTGHCGYTKRGETSSRHPGDHATRYPIAKTETLTAASMMARLFLGHSRQEPIMQKAADLVAKKPPIWSKNGDIDHLYWYCGTYAMYQMGGDHWRDWHRALTPAVIATQRRDDNFNGSWDPVGVWGEDGGRVYATALMVLTTEAHFRYTRLIR